MTTVTGILYATATTISGQPMDTVKTKMQAQDNFQKGGLMEAIKRVYRTEGVLGYYKGFFPMWFGCIGTRGSQFAIVELFYSMYKDDPVWTKKIPFTGGIELRLVGGAVAASVARTLAECPFEYIKVRS